MTEGRVDLLPSEPSETCAQTIAAAMAWLEWQPKTLEMEWLEGSAEVYKKSDVSF